MTNVGIFASVGPLMGSSGFIIAQVSSPVPLQPWILQVLGDRPAASVTRFLFLLCLNP